MRILNMIRQPEKNSNKKIYIGYLPVGRSVQKNIFPRFQKRPETEGKYFSVRTDLNGK